MTLKQDILARIENGSVTLAFRRWRRPTVKAGGTLLTSIGQLAIEAVDIVDLAESAEADAVAAGSPTLAALRSELTSHSHSDIYRVRLSFAGPDPRIALRRDVPCNVELQQILERLGLFDRRSALGPWTHRVLESLGEKPATRAADLAPRFGMDTAEFKAKVRWLKTLGLTESLSVGYRLSPRGIVVLDVLKAKTT